MKARPLKEGSPERLADEQALQQPRNMPENTFAIGAIATNEIVRRLKDSALSIATKSSPTTTAVSITGWTRVCRSAQGR